MRQAPDVAGAHHDRAGSSVRLLVVDDRPQPQELLLYLFASDQEIKVVGSCASSEEAIGAVRLHRPDVMVIDMDMAGMDGIALTRAIMESTPVPIVILSSVEDAGTGKSFEALAAGAVAVVKRPAEIDHPDHVAEVRALIQAVKLMAEVRVVRRWPVRHKAREPEKKVFAHRLRIALVAMGASTGGPQALGRILARLPRDFTPPVLIVQHMTDGFTEGFCQWLGETSGYGVRLAMDGETAGPGLAYVAPYGRQMAVDVEGRIRLSRDASENGHLPSVSWLFRSVAKAYGARAAGVLLTGMGRDGAAELGEMRRQGAVTLVQDKDSSVVHGMPGEALALGAATCELPPEEIAAALVSLAR